MKNCTTGLYAWGGPQTIRLLQKKYHSPKIDIQSFESLYDVERMKQAIDVFDAHDIWISYSWGFSQSNEYEDQKGIASKIHTLQSLGLRVHLYVQGLNLVSSDFDIGALACIDPYGRTIPYSKGRSLVCPNNPKVIDILVERVRKAAIENADGVYVDNILFGFPPAFIRSDFAPFFGCSCQHCQKDFYSQFGYSLTFPIEGTKHLQDYLDFRSHTITTLVSELSDIAHRANKNFGINLYDPIQMNSIVYFGYKLEAIEPYLDYFLIENHSLPSRKHTNTHLSKLIRDTDKPVFVVSYDHGIGFEPEYSQYDFDHIASESCKVGYKPCYKVSEFTTNRIWHTLDFSKLEKLNRDIKISKDSTPPSYKLHSKQWHDSFLAKLVGYFGIPLVSLYFENSFLHSLGNAIYRKGIHSWKNFTF